MNRYGMKAFWKRFINPFGSGQPGEKLRRRVWRARLVAAVRRRRAARLPVDSHKVLFVTSSWTCTCNPKYIARELARRRPDIDIVWLLSDAACRACVGKPDSGNVVGRLLAATPYQVDEAYKNSVLDSLREAIGRFLPAKETGTAASADGGRRCA